MNLLQLMPDEKVCGVTVSVTDPFAGGGLAAMTVSVGDSLGSGSTYASVFSTTAAGSATFAAPLSAPRGNGIVQANFTSSGANLSSASMGSIDFGICVVSTH
jgi:hypothetical protein